MPGRTTIAGGRSSSGIVKSEPFLMRTAAARRPTSVAQGEGKAASEFAMRPQP